MALFIVYVEILIFAVHKVKCCAVIGILQYKFPFIYSVQNCLLFTARFHIFMETMDKYFREKGISLYTIVEKTMQRKEHKTHAQVHKIFFVGKCTG